MKTKVTRIVPPSHGPAGFTLTELLVAIAILAALAALSVAGIRTVKQKAMVAYSAAALRENGVAIQGFIADKSRFPEAWDFRGGSGGGSWSWQIRDYLGYQNVETWPAKSLLHPRHGTGGIDAARGWDRERLHHYASSAVVFQDVNDTKGFTKAVHVSRPESTIMLGDAPLIRPQDPASGCDAAWWSLREGAVSGNPQSPAPQSTVRNSIDFWINGKAQFLFVDGHVETLAPNQVLRKHFQLQ